jgi:hypothetical protein
MVFGGFPKKNSNKTFIFTIKKIIALLVFTLFWPISGAKKIAIQKQKTSKDF